MSPPSPRQRNGAPRRARIRLRSGNLYEATVELSGLWVHLTDAWRLSPHLGGYARTQVDDATIPARDVRRINWLVTQ